MPKPDISAQRREQILDAAQNVFSRAGFERARMDDIVQESGLSKGALYWYFKSKDEIIQAILDRIFMTEMSEALALAELDAPAGERLQDFYRIGVAEIRKLQPLFPLFYEFVPLVARRKKVREIVLQYYKRYIDVAQQIVEQGIESGEFKPVDPESTATLLVGYLEGMTLMWFLDPEFIDWDRLGDQPMGIFLDGLRKAD
jgi:AcrR family transcriptional regulator